MKTHTDERGLTRFFLEPKDVEIQNLIHARDNGLLSTCKINMDIANRIREDYKNGIKRRFLVEKYGIRKSQINCIINFERWK